MSQLHCRTSRGSKVAPLIDKGALSYLPVNTPRPYTRLTAKTHFGFDGLTANVQVPASLEGHYGPDGALLGEMPPGTPSEGQLNSFSGKETACKEARRKRWKWSSRHQAR